MGPLGKVRPVQHPTQPAPVAALRRARAETNERVAEAQGELARRQQAVAQAEHHLAGLLGDLTAFDDAIDALTIRPELPDVGQ